MKKKDSSRSFKPTLSCMQGAVLRHLVKIAGLQDMTIWRNRNNEWHLSVTVKLRSQVLYLSTRRAPRSPRAFTRLDLLASGGTQALYDVEVIGSQSSFLSFSGARDGRPSACQPCGSAYRRSVFRSRLIYPRRQTGLRAGGYLCQFTTCATRPELDWRDGALSQSYADAQGSDSRVIKRFRQALSLLSLDPIRHLDLNLPGWQTRSTSGLCKSTFARECPGSSLRDRKT